MQILAARLTRRNGKREREREWERFGHSGVALRIDVEMRRGRHSFILGREERPLLDELQVAHIKDR
jgi:hypothetical protein